MNTEYKVDRTDWPSGPWDKEPDRVDFEHAGFACMLIRNQVGAWCGYVGVPAGNPNYGKGYDDVDVSVHGGLTYASKCQGHICHVPKPGMPDDVWWLGFDTAHAGDGPPGLIKMYSGMKHNSLGTYKTMVYARRETEQLAEQLKG